MKRHILLAAAILGVAVSAAAITISAPQKIEAPEGSHHPVLSPDGKTLLFSTQDHTGLKAMDLTTGGIATIDTDAAAGFAPIFNADGTKVFYRTAMLVDGLLCHDVRSYDIAKDAKPVKLQSYSRKTPSNLNTVSANDNYAFADYRDILVCHNGVTTKNHALVRCTLLLVGFAIARWHTSAVLRTFRRRIRSQCRWHTTAAYSIKRRFPRMALQQHGSLRSHP